MAIRNTITPSFVQVEHVIAAVRLPAHVGNVGVSGRQAAGEEDEEKAEDLGVSLMVCMCSLVWCDSGSEASRRG